MVDVVYDSGDSGIIEVVCPYKKDIFHSQFIIIINYEEDSQHFLVYSIS